MRAAIVAAQCFVAALCIAAPTLAAAQQYRVIRALPVGVAGQVRVEAIAVTVSADAAAAMVAHDAKAARRLGASNMSGTDPVAMPFVRMFPRVAGDVFADWNLAGPRAVKLYVTIDLFQVANVGAAMTTGTRDAMSGLVEVVDASGGTPLAMFTVRVINRHAGWSGMLLRGGGVREKLVQEFALESARVLSGRKKKKL